ncbi:hypothetical protein ACJ73_08481 [Blastomyces percursus]|uniref:Uncharacterized protein n=1 Tax=Blastomyces percursus TaxID=1658174 RepID=A0A1J9PWA4_9EURO|nr:hypothetical protein ACJ73_08481 [Blastomyces percursus]
MVTTRSEREYTSRDEPSANHLEPQPSMHAPIIETFENDGAARLRELQEQIRGREQRLAILAAQQRINELDSQLRERSRALSQSVHGFITSEGAVEQSEYVESRAERRKRKRNARDDSDSSDDESPPKLEIKEHYKGKNMLDFKDFKDRLLTIFARHYRYYKTEERKINDAKMFLDPHVKQKWLNYVTAYEKREGTTPLTFNDMLTHLEMQINDPENQRRMANQRFQDAYQKEWQSIRDFSKYLEDWEYYLPAYSEQQRMDNLRSKALPGIRKELLRYAQEPADYEELLRRMQTIEENMPERMKAIKRGRNGKNAKSKFNDKDNAKSNAATSSKKKDKFRWQKTCIHCKKRGHTSDECWLLHPEKREKVQEAKN